jgi:hypothetical protein
MNLCHEAHATIRMALLWARLRTLESMRRRQDEHVLRAPTVAGAGRLHRLTLAIQVARRAYEDARAATSLFS